MSDPVDAARGRTRRRRPPLEDADVGAELAQYLEHGELVSLVMGVLSERAGGGGFAVIPDGDKWTLYRVVRFSTAWHYNSFTGELGAAVEGDPLYELVPITEDES